MQVRKITLAEKPTLSAIQAIAFLVPTDIDALQTKIKEHPEEVTYDQSWACFDDDGTMVSGLENWPLNIYYDGHIVGMGGIGGVASAPEHRTRGGIRAIFEKVFADDIQNERLFSVLFPFSHPYYRQFGYEICHESRHIRFHVESLTKYRLTCSVRRHMPQEGFAPFDGVYRRYAAQYSYAVARQERNWKGIASGDPLKAEAYPYILSRDGEDIAYCIFRAQREADQRMTMILTDYAYVDKAALHDLLGFLYRLRAQFTFLQMEVPDTFEMAALLDEPYDITIVSQTRTMARVLDVARALRLMRHPGGAGSYTLAIEDAFLPANTGIYRVSYAEAAVTVTRDTTAQPDLSLSVQAFAQLCLGYLALDMACLRQDVTLHGNAEILRQVFVRKAKFLTDRF